MLAETMGIRTPEHRSARSGEKLGGAAAPPSLGGGVKLHPTVVYLCVADTVCFWDIKKNVKPSNISGLSGIF
jgi:hypothetical protein